MTGQQLKNSILQMAVQGKLVPQDPNDEPASVLVERIRAEKEKLIKEKKIKKEKNPSYIFRGADNLPYEQVGKNEPVCIADEVPFEIPESWEWTRLKNVIVQDMGGGTPDKSNPNYWNGNIPWMSVKDFSGAKNGVIEDTVDHITEEGVEHSSTNVIDNNAIVLCTRIGLGKYARLSQPTAINQDLRAIWLSPNICEEFFLFFYSTLNITGSGVTVKGIKRDELFATLMPLPPLDEQRRITDKLNAVTPLIDEYASAYENVDSLNHVFPDRLKKSILQWAVQGKLVPQDPDDEPASVLLDRIREEKARLVKEGKIKKDKNESIIFRRDNSHYEKRGKIEVCIDDEIPFDIPDSWEWVRFYEIAFFENGDRSSKYPIEADYVPDGIPFFGAKDMGAKYMDFATVRFISQEKFDQLSNGKLQDDDMICLLRGNVGKTRIFKRSDKYLTGFICAQMMIIRCIDKRILEYLYSVISSPYYTRAIEAKVTGTAVRQLPAKEVAKILIPLPPVAEQQRILSIIQELSTPLITL